MDAFTIRNLRRSTRMQDFFAGRRAALEPWTALPGIILNGLRTLVRIFSCKKHAPDETRSFMVIVYDVTAQFTHWAMYNIPAGTTRLPENAGIADSGYGIQNGNDFFSPSYGGPCPPTTLQPFVHEYSITVYALDEFLPVVKAFGD